MFCRSHAKDLGEHRVFKRVSQKLKCVAGHRIFHFYFESFRKKNGFKNKKINDLITLRHYNIYTTKSDIMGIVNMIWVLFMSAIPGLNVPK